MKILGYHKFNLKTREFTSRTVNNLGELSAQGFVVRFFHFLFFHMNHTKNVKIPQYHLYTAKKIEQNEVYAENVKRKHFFCPPFSFRINLFWMNWMKNFSKTLLGLFSSNDLNHCLSRIKIFFYYVEQGLIASVQIDSEMFLMGTLPVLWDYAIII